MPRSYGAISTLRNQQKQHRERVWTSAELREISELGLRPSDFEVIVMVAQGFRNEDIAGKLILDLQTIKTRMSLLLRQFKVPDRTTLVVRAHQLGLIDVGAIKIQKVYRE